MGVQCPPCLLPNSVVLWPCANMETPRRAGWRIPRGILRGNAQVPRESGNVVRGEEGRVLRDRGGGGKVLGLLGTWNRGTWNTWYLEYLVLGIEVLGILGTWNGGTWNRGTGEEGAGLQRVGRGARKQCLEDGGLSRNKGGALARVRMTPPTSITGPGKAGPNGLQHCPMIWLHTHHMGVARTVWTLVRR